MVHMKKPCSICGNLIAGNKMKEHMNTNHTEGHLKPFMCSVCRKGFGTSQRLADHMNIHTGDRPYVCQYCGRGFANHGNKRMHEKCSHEGYRRPNK